MLSRIIAKIALISILIAINIDRSMCGVTLDQMMAAGRLMRDVCHPKFPKVSTEVADNIKNGIIPDDKDTKCYINCILEMMQITKKGKFLYESSLKQIDILLPDDHKEEYRAGLTACKTVAVGIKNHCDASYTLLLCLKEKIARFLFP